MANSGYTQCACRDCFDIAISSNERVPELCSDCKKAGCDRSGESDCERSDAYGMDSICPNCLCWVSKSCTNHLPGEG